MCAGLGVRSWPSELQKLEQVHSSVRPPNWGEEDQRNLHQIVQKVDDDEDDSDDDATDRSWTNMLELSDEACSDFRLSTSTARVTARLNICLQECQIERELGLWSVNKMQQVKICCRALQQLNEEAGERALVTAGAVPLLIKVLYQTGPANLSDLTDGAPIIASQILSNFDDTRNAQLVVAAGVCKPLVLMLAEGRSEPVQLAGAAALSELTDGLNLPALAPPLVALLSRSLNKISVLRSTNARPASMAELDDVLDMVECTKYTLRGLANICYENTGMEVAVKAGLIQPIAHSSAQTNGCLHSTYHRCSKAKLPERCTL